MKTFLSQWVVLGLAVLTAASQSSSLAAVPAVEAGDILVANYRAGNNTVLRINPATGVQHKLGVFSTPTDLALAPGGQLFVSEWSGAIKRLNLVDGTVTLVNSNSSLSQIWGMTLGPGGDLFVTSGAGNRVIRISLSTGAETLITQNDRLSLPIGIDFLDADHAVVASMLNSRVVSVRLSDQSQAVVAPDAHAFNDPWGIAVLGTNIYVGAHDSKWLQRISGTNVTGVAQLAGAPFGIGVDTNGDIIVGISGGLTGPFAVVRVGPDGDALATYSGGQIGEVTGVAVSQSTVLAVEQANTNPTLDELTDQVAEEGAMVAFIATAGDTNWPLQNLTFGLDPGAPEGAAMSPDGVFTWTPSEIQGPGQYLITVNVTDDGEPPLSTAASFRVTVDEVNSDPQIEPITNRTVVAGTPIVFNAMASDPDVPAQALTFSLAAGAPDGAVISPAGQFTWTPSDLQAPGSYSIQVIVEDDGTPPLSATSAFTVFVNQKNVPPVIPPIPDKTVNENSLLSFPITAVDSNRPVQSLTFSLDPSAPSGARLTAGGQFTWTPTEEQGPGTYAFTAMVTDNGAPPLSATNTFTVTVNEVNRPPNLAPLVGTNVLFGTPVTFTAQATDTDLPAQELTFSLETNAPAGASISPDGVFAWTPDVSQAPSTNLIRVRVTDNGTPPLTATQSCSIVVRVNLVVEAGDILVADNGSDTLYKVNPQTGVVVPLAPFSYPTDVAISTNGAIYVSEWGGLVKRFDLTNGTTTILNAGTAMAGVWGLALGPSGDLFVTSSSDNRVVRINPETGIETVVAHDDLLSGPCGIAVLDPEHLVVTSFNDGRIVKVSLADGAQSPLATVPEILNPWGAAVHGTNIYIAGFDQQAVEKISGNTAAIMGYTPGLPFGIGTDTNGDILVGVSGDTVGLTRIIADGTASTFTLEGLIGPVTGLEVSPIQVGVSTPSNAPPVLNLIADQLVDEGNLLTFAATASDPDVPAQVLTFTLEPGAPPGASFSTNGLFQWTPTEADGPGTNRITVKVTDSGMPPLSATQSFVVVVNEVNVAPTLPAIAPQIVDEGMLLIVPLDATDADLPGQTLTYSLGPGAPNGATVTGDGVLTWTPGETNGPGTNLIMVVVNDTGTPPLSATNSVTVVVNEVNLAPTLTPIADQSVDEGSLLTFAATASDPDVPAQVLTFTLEPGVPTGVVLSTNGIFQWTPTDSDGPGTNRITVKVTDSGTPPLSATQSFVVVVNELYLQSSAAVTGPYLDEPGARFDKAQNRVTAAWSRASGFYRLRSSRPVRITRLELVGNEIILTYEFLNPPNPLPAGLRRQK